MSCIDSDSMNITLLSSLCTSHCCNGPFVHVCVCLSLKASLNLTHPSLQSMSPSAHEWFYLTDHAISPLPGLLSSPCSCLHVVLMSNVIISEVICVKFTLEASVHTGSLSLTRANPWGRLKWPYAIARLTPHFMCGLTSHLVICKFRKSMVMHNTECPYWNTNPTLSHWSWPSLIHKAKWRWLPSNKQASHHVCESMGVGT